MVSHSAVACIVPDVRRGAWAAGLATALSLTAAPPPAGDPSPVGLAQPDNVFFPPGLTVAPDTTGFWENRGPAHNVRFEDGQFEQPADPQATPWQVQRHFDEPGVYRYYCEMHGGVGGQGMSGEIIVEAGANPVLDGLRVTPRRICMRRTRRCRTV